MLNHIRKMSISAWLAVDMAMGKNGGDRVPQPLNKSRLEHQSIYNFSSREIASNSV